MFSLCSFKVKPCFRAIGSLSLANRVAEHGDELPAKFVSLALPEQPRFPEGISNACQMRRDQFDKPLIMIAVMSGLVDVGEKGSAG